MQECFKKTTNMYSFHNYWKQIDLQCEYAPEEIPTFENLQYFMVWKYIFLVKWCETSF